MKKMTSPDQKEKRACLGKIAAPHGIKGLVKIFPYGENPYLIETLSPVFMGENTNETLSISLKNMMGKFYLAEIKGCNTREDAEKLKGREIWVNRSALPDLDNKNEFYIDDLNGLNAYDEQTGENIGTIINVQNYGAGDLLEFKPHLGQSYFIPFQDDYIGDVNLDEQKLFLRDAERFKIE